VAAESTARKIFFRAGKLFTDLLLSSSTLPSHAKSPGISGFLVCYKNTASSFFKSIFITEIGLILGPYKFEQQVISSIAPCRNYKRHKNPFISSDTELKYPGAK